MLKISYIADALRAKNCGGLLLFVPPMRRLPAAARAADVALRGLVSEVRKRGDFRGKAGETLWLHLGERDGKTAKKLPFPRVLLAGVGATDEEQREGFAAGFAALCKADIKTAAADFSALSAEQTQAAVVAAYRAAYKFRRGGFLPEAGKLTKIFAACGGTPNRAAANLAAAAAVGEGVQTALHLAEQPGNVCTPDFLAQAVKAMAAAAAKSGGLEVSVLGEQKIAQLKMGGLLAVSQGSANPPRFIVLRHNGARGKRAKSAPVVLVGKGVTFDTGGISLKPAAAMDEMKFDMCGAASVAGTLLACARAKLPLNVVGLIPACENMPGGKAVKPGDVITMMSGKSVEVLNTDAEGRLILGDALHYAARFSPAAVVDIATLTGACVIALGHHTSGLLGRGEAFLREVQAAGEAAGDACWRLPLGAAYRKQLKSDFADIANIGGRSAGTITAAQFLAEFVACKHWAHLDIAGTAWTPKKRATGRPVPLLFNLLAARVAAKKYVAKKPAKPAAKKSAAKKVAKKPAKKAKSAKKGKKAKKSAKKAR